METGRERDADFDRCIDFLVRMIELYGAEVLQEIEELESNHGKECVA